jgi:hypothetical protein
MAQDPTILIALLNTFILHQRLAVLSDIFQPLSFSIFVTDLGDNTLVVIV